MIPHQPLHLLILRLNPQIAVVVIVAVLTRVKLNRKSLKNLSNGNFNRKRNLNPTSFIPNLGPTAHKLVNQFNWPKARENSKYCIKVKAQAMILMTAMMICSLTAKDLHNFHKLLWIIIWRRSNNTNLWTWWFRWSIVRVNHFKPIWPKETKSKDMILSARARLVNLKKPVPLIERRIFTSSHRLLMEWLRFITIK